MLSKTVCRSTVSRRSYQELTLSSQAPLFHLHHVLLSSLLPRQKHQLSFPQIKEIMVTSHMWHWSFLSPWSQVLMASSLQNASAFLRITGPKCPAIYQATLEKCQHKDFELNNSVVVLLFGSERKPVLGPMALDLLPHVVRERWATDHTKSNPEPASARHNSCLVFSPLNHHPNPSDW